MNIKLFPFAVFDLHDFTMDIGQDIPKLTTIIASKNSLTLPTCSFMKFQY